MKKRSLVFLAGLFMSGCMSKIDPKISHEINEFRGDQKCLIKKNFLDVHNSGSVNFQLIKETSGKKSNPVYFILIVTGQVAHDFPKDAIMHLTIDGQTPRKLVAKTSEKSESNHSSYMPGYMSYSRKYGNHYTPGTYYTTYVRVDSVLFPVDKDLIEALARAKKVSFAIEGNVLKLEGELSPDNFIPVRNFVSECVHGIKPKNEE